MRILIALAFAGLAASTSGCLNWQESYNVAARADCMKLPDVGERQACLNAVERNASEKRAEQRERQGS
jgi:hypothetical protein